MYRGSLFTENARSESLAKICGLVQGFANSTTGVAVLVMGLVMEILVRGGYG